MSRIEILDKAVPADAQAFEAWWAENKDRWLGLKVCAAAAWLAALQYSTALHHHAHVAKERDVSEMKHTPGSWQVGEFRTRISVRNDRGVICGMSIHLNSMRHDEGLANARLIAAAPDLLEALRGLLEHACIADAAPEDVDEEDRARERAARAAIAKATAQP